MGVRSVAYPPKESMGVVNIVIDGKLYKNVPNTITYVEQESDLDLLVDAQPGDFAATFGFAKLWQYDGSAWQEI